MFVNVRNVVREKHLMYGDKMKCSLCKKNEADEWLVECGNPNAGYCKGCNLKYPVLHEIWKMGGKK